MNASAAPMNTDAAPTSSATADSTPPESGRRSRRHRRHGRRHRKSRRAGGAPRGDLRAWLHVIDGVLRAVEETAWTARGLAESAADALDRGEREVTAARGMASEWTEQVPRLTQTGLMLARMAAGYRMHGFTSAFVTREKAEQMLNDLHAKSARRFYEVSAVHGGAFMKVGQLLSARADVLPKVWVDELQKLQDAAPTLPFETVRATLEAELGRPLGELFASFEETPIGAASIGQVHRATTKDGTVVAVKVQRPGVAGKVKMDLELLEMFVGSLESSLPETDYDTIISEIREKVLAEVDYTEEAKHTKALADFFAEHPGIQVPQPIPGLCTAHVLTTTFVEGRKLTTVLDELEARAAAGDATAKHELSSVLGHLLEAYLRQVLHAGAFQADPHPGNLLVTPAGQVVVLDFGCAQVLTDDVRERYLGLMGAFMSGDRERMGELFLELGFKTKSGQPDTLHVFADALLTEIRQAAFAGGVQWPTRAQLAERAAELLGACEDDPVVGLPGEFIMIARVFGTLGGLFTRYRPDIDFGRHVLPVLGPVLFQFQ